MYNKKFISVLVLVMILTSITPVFAKDTYNGYRTIGIELNGENLKGDVPAIVMDNRTLVPIRLVSENLGVKVEWDPKAKEVILKELPENSYPKESKDKESEDMEAFNEYKLASRQLAKWAYLNSIESAKHMLEYISTIDVISSEFSKLIPDNVINDLVTIKVDRYDIALNLMEHYNYMSQQTAEHLNTLEKTIDNTSIARNKDYIKLKENNKLLLDNLQKFMKSLDMLGNTILSTVDKSVHLTPGTLENLQERAIEDFKSFYTQWQNSYNLVYFDYLPKNDKTTSELGKYRGYDIVNVTLNGSRLKGDVPAIIMDGRTLVPIRLVSENLGVEVNWNESENKVELKENANVQKPDNNIFEEYKLMSEAVNTWIRISNDSRNNNIDLTLDRAFFQKQSAKMAKEDKDEFNSAFLYNRINFINEIISYEESNSNKDFYIKNLKELEKDLDKSSYAKNKEYLELKSKANKLISIDRKNYNLYKNNSSGKVNIIEFNNKYRPLQIELINCFNESLNN